jgi:3-methyladenine DNA glycosylase AlkD
MNAAQIQQAADEVIARLRACKDHDRHAATANYYPSAQENLGVYAADIRAVVRDFKRRLKGEPARDVIALAHAIIARNTMEGRQVAYETIMHHKAAREALTCKELEKLGKGIDNWASVDVFACGLSGPAWRDGRITDADVQRWARSKDPWWRRAAVVSTVPLNTASKGGKGDTRRTLLICEMSVGDDHIMVHKALSWALRQLAGPDRKAAEGFLNRHNEALPALVRREVSNKLRSGRKSGK